MSVERPNILVVVAHFYEDFADELMKGARHALDAAGCVHEVLEVPGAFEIPAAIRMAIRSRDFYAAEPRFDGYVALGCIIRGETSHYDYVCGESARKLMDLATDYALALGYGIVTCENEEQARERVGVGRKNKGGAAAEACLAMLAVKRRFHLFPR